MHFPAPLFTLLTTLLPLTTNAAPPAPPPPAKPAVAKHPGPTPALRNLPIGDSITEGYTSPSGNGYRLPLAHLLHPLANTTFVGTLHSGSMPNNAHSGFDAKTIAQITTLAAPGLASLRPDVILIHAGTNDITATASQRQLDGAPWRLATLIQKAVGSNPHAAVLVAQIINKNPGVVGTRVDAFNAKVPGVVAPFAARGNNVMVVDMRAIKGPADLVDGVHPKEEGYVRMGALWFGGIRAAARKGWILRAPRGLEAIGGRLEGKGKEG